LYAAVAPPPDPNAGTEIQQQTQQAEQAENEATQDSGVPVSAAPVAPAAPQTVKLGQTLDEVQAALGAPAKVANLGPKVIYYYSGVKVIFKNGKVSDVQ
jgi:hypothetical protein